MNSIEVFVSHSRLEFGMSSLTCLLLTRRRQLPMFLSVPMRYSTFVILTSIWYHTG
jgi:hypothetical protein